MQKPPIEAASDVQEYGNEIFTSEDEMKESLARLCHGDLYVIGRLWIQALRAVLVGANLSLIPVVHAAKPEESPKKPPPMKYKDLPIYESPHYEYKDYVEDKKKCPKANVKLLHQYLYPKVRSCRKSWCESLCDFAKDFGELKDDACAAILKKQREFKKYMRCPDNAPLRQGVVALGTIVGYYIGSGRGIPRRLFFTSIGALASGALCFPKETDEIFRNVSFQIGKLALTVLNITCHKNFSMRERLPCPDDLPPPPPQRQQQNKCDHKK